MSDGNFNRNLLPYHPYASGLRAGRARMHTQALHAFSAWIEEQGLEGAAAEDACKRFRRLLDGESL